MTRKVNRQDQKKSHRIVMIAPILGQHSSKDFSLHIFQNLVKRTSYPKLASYHFVEFLLVKKKDIFIKY